MSFSMHILDTFKSSPHLNPASPLAKSPEPIVAEDAASYAKEGVPHRAVFMCITKDVTSHIVLHRHQLVIP